MRGPAEFGREMRDRFPAGETPHEQRGSLPTASQPCGANGCRFAVRACGAEASTAASSSVTSSADNTSCMRPETVTPNAFAADTVAISAAAVTMTVVCPPPVTAAT